MNLRPISLSIHQRVHTRQRHRAEQPGVEWLGTLVVWAAPYGRVPVSHLRTTLLQKCYWYSGTTFMGRCPTRGTIGQRV